MDLHQPMAAAHQPSPGPEAIAGFRSPSPWMTRHYLLALGVVAFLTVLGFLIFGALLSAHDRQLELVNESGRQRMLSQRMALYVQRMESGACAAPGERAACATILTEAADQFAAAHAQLRRAASPAVAELYDSGMPSLDDRIRDYLAAVRLMATAPDPLPPAARVAAARVQTAAAGPLLTALDAVVLAYQREGEAALAELRAMEAAAVLLTLLTLGLEAVLVFRPMVRRIQGQFDAIGGLGDALSAANRDLEARIAARTLDLAAAKAEAERATRSKSRFLAAAGHDMLQPLEAGDMFLALLATEPSAERRAALLADLGATHQSLRHLVRSVLDMARLEAQVLLPHRRPVAVQDLLRRVAAQVGPLAAARELRLNVVPSRAWIDTDPQMCERILLNLAGNAVRYTDRGGVVLGARRRGGKILLVVADSGRGIDPRDHQRVFEAFVQVGGGRDRSDGLGLGLPVADGLSKLLGHRLLLTSRPGHGTVVCLEADAATPPAQT